MPNPETIGSRLNKAHWLPNKRALPLILVIFLLLGFLGCGKDKGPEDAWLAFTVAMDALYGEGSWKSASHSYQDGTLTVSGISITLTLKGQGANGADLNIPVTVGTVEVVDIANSDDMKKAMGDKSWELKNDQPLAAKATIKGVASKTKPDNETDFELSVESIAMDSPVLKAGAGNAPQGGGPGTADWLRRVSLSSYSLGKLETKLDSKGGVTPDVALTFKLESLAAANVAFTGEGPLNDGSLTDVLLSLKADSLSMKGADSGLIAGDGNDMDFQIANFEIKGLDGFAKFQDSQLADVRLLLDLPQDDIRKVDFAFKKLGVKNYEGVEFLRESIMRVLAAYQTKSINPGGDTKIGELFTYPYSFDSASVEGLSLNLDGLLFGVDAAEYQGPVKRHVIPNFKITLDNLHAQLNPEGLTDSLKAEVEDFVDTFQRKDLRVDGTFSSTYDENSGKVRYDYERVSFSGLAELKFHLELNGLTKPLVASLSRISVGDALQAALLSGITQVGIDGFSLSYEDKGLANLLFQKEAKDMGVGVDDAKADLIMLATQGLSKTLSPSMFPNANQALSKAITTFVSDPKSFEIVAKPNGTLDIATATNVFVTTGGASLITTFANPEATSDPIALFGAMGLGDNSPTPALFNLLNLTLSVNGSDPQAITLN
ncbi:MAG: hypothetical protein LBF40_07830 [Deltaproteobacteria bacterium]|jgi:hypothetical protein|nr:hypothetical protein [Deltaproteobacteria bacterium]